MRNSLRILTAARIAAALLTIATASQFAFASTSGNVGPDCVNTNPPDCPEDKCCEPCPCDTGEGGQRSGHNTGQCVTGNCSEGPGGPSMTTQLIVGNRGNGYSYSPSTLGEIDPGRFMVVDRRVDMNVAAAGPGGFPMAPSRTYNNLTISNSDNIDGKSCLGPYWHFNYDMAIEWKSGTTDRLLRMSNGGHNVLFRDATDHNLWTSRGDYGAAVRLVYASGVFTLTQPDPGIVYTFDVAGKLIKIRGHNGHTLTLTRDVNHVLTQIDLDHENPSLDADTRYLTFHYDTFTTFTYPQTGLSLKRLTRITAWDGSYLQYGYDTYGMLQTLVNSRGELVDFRGNGPGPFYNTNQHPLMLDAIGNDGSRKFDGSDLSAYYYKRSYLYGETGVLSEVRDEDDELLYYVEWEDSISAYFNTAVRKDGTRVVQTMNHARDPMSIEIQACDGANCEDSGGTLSYRTQQFLIAAGGGRDSQLPKIKVVNTHLELAHLQA